jgi:predicted PurR-regulated permease PerM
VVYLAAVEQRWGAAIFLAIYGAAVVSSIDNVIKMYVLHGRSTMHPLFALLSVLGGVKVFGPIGILVGPMVVVFLQTLLEILNHELAERDASTINHETDPVLIGDGGNASVPAVEVGQPTSPTDVDRSSGGDDS